MKKPFFVSLFSIITIYAHSQIPMHSFSKTPGAGSGNGIITDVSGNVFIAGQGASNGILLAKYDNFGQQQWEHNIGTLGSARAVSTDAASNVYVTGSFKGTNVDFDPGAGAVNLSSAENDIFVAKYNSSGQYQWAFTIGGPAGIAISESGNSISTDAAGNVYVSGSFDSTNVDFDPGAGTALLSSNGGQDIFVAKYNTSGQYQWAFNIGGSNAMAFGQYDCGKAISVDANGNAYVIGYFKGANIDFDPAAGIANLSSSGTGRNIFVVKYNTNGIYQWAFNIETLGGNNPYTDMLGISADNFGNVIATGSFKGTNVDFDPGAASAPMSSTNEGMFVAKYTNNGVYKWAFNVIESGNGFIGVEPCAISTDASGNIYIAGDFSGPNVDFNPGAGTASLSGPQGLATIFVAQYDSAGQYKWAFPLGTVGDNMARAISADAGGNVSVVGDFQGPNIDFDPNSGTAYLSSGNSKNIFVAKYSPISNGNIINPTACESYTSPSGLYTWTISGTYSDTLTTTSQTDSVITINLTIITINKTVNQSTNGIVLSSNEVGATYQWLDCGNGNVAIVGATNKTYTVTTNGNYAVSVTKGGCMDTSACVVVTSVSIYEMGYENNFRIFPNPNNGAFLITSIIEGDYLITDELGRTIDLIQLNSENQNSVNISNLPIGVYFIMGVENNNAEVRQKIIVMK